MTEKDPREQKKIREAMRGNLQAYGDLVTSHQDYLYRIAYLYTRDEQMALDAVGSSILKGFTAIRKLKDPAFFMTWLTRILLLWMSAGNGPVRFRQRSCRKSPCQKKASARRKRWIFGMR